MANNTDSKGAIIIARMDSTRFPGKAGVLISGRPLIEWCVSALQGVDEFTTIMATTDRKIDNTLVDIAKRCGIAYFRGALDVSERVASCIKEFSLKYFARVNGDSPFTRKELLTEGFGIIKERDLDFVTNLVPRAFPYGISVEILKSSTYLEILPRLTTDYYREHITSYFYEHLEIFKTYCMQYTYGNDHDVRLVVDTYLDKERIEKMLALSKNVFSLSIPEIVKIYRGIVHD